MKHLQRKEKWEKGKMGQYSKTRKRGIYKKRIKSDGRMANYKEKENNTNKMQKMEARNQRSMRLMGYCEKKA